MGHRDGSTYDRYYAVDLIAKDFQSIYFGTPSQDSLVEAISRMGLSPDRRAPKDLTDEQELEIKNDSSLVKLRAKRDRCKDKIRRRYSCIQAAKGSK